MNLRYFKYFIISSALIIGFSSCSLKYGNETKGKLMIPELVSEGSTFDRIENQKTSFSVNAKKMEQYRDGSVSYSKDLEFKIFDSEEKLQTEGSCDFLTANSESKEYILSGNIKITQIEDGLTIFAESLKWNETSQKLVSENEKKVRLEKDNLKVEGFGFSADASEQSFSFSGAVEGSYVTSDENS